jgi:hypothetical protein
VPTAALAKEPAVAVATQEHVAPTVVIVSAPAGKAHHRLIQSYSVVAVARDKRQLVMAPRGEEKIRREMERR